VPQLMAGMLGFSGLVLYAAMVNKVGRLRRIVRRNVFWTTYSPQNALGQ
jgi:hypothetical protein